MGSDSAREGPRDESLCNFSIAFVGPRSTRRSAPTSTTVQFPRVFYYFLFFLKFSLVVLPCRISHSRTREITASGTPLSLSLSLSMLLDGASRTLSQPPLSALFEKADVWIQLDTSGYAWDMQLETFGMIQASCRRSGTRCSSRRRRRIKSVKLNGPESVRLSLRVCDSQVRRRAVQRRRAPLQARTNLAPDPQNTPRLVTTKGVRGTQTLLVGSEFFVFCFKFLNF